MLLRLYSNARACLRTTGRAKLLVGAFATSVAASLFSSVPASAMKIGVEPYLGYSQFTYTSDGISDSKMGTVLGGRGGLYVTDKAWVALDYHLGGPYYLANDDKNEYMNRMWGAGVGYVPGNKARCWGGYYFNSKIDDLEHNQLLDGKGFKASVGFEIQPQLFFNFEFSKQSYQITSGFNQTQTLDVSVLFVSLSSPLTLN